MSAWRREAIKCLPEMRAMIESAENPMALWIDLQIECDKAYKSISDQDRIDRIFDYARWCFSCPNMDVKTAVTVAFYEHLPINRYARADLPNRFSTQEFKLLKNVFAYHLEPAELLTLEREFNEAKKLNRP